MLDGEAVGLIEVELLSVSDVRSRQFGWADIGNLWVAEEHRRRRVASWLLASRPTGSASAGSSACSPTPRRSRSTSSRFVAHHGFRELVRTERGWVRT